MKNDGGTDVEPVVDPSQDYVLISGHENATHTVLRFRRNLDTCDTLYDVPITVSDQLNAHELHEMFVWLYIIGSCFRTLYVCVRQLCAIYCVRMLARRCRCVFNFFFRLGSGIQQSAHSCASASHKQTTKAETYCAKNANTPTDEQKIHSAHTCGNVHTHVAHQSYEVHTHTHTYECTAASMHVRRCMKAGALH